MSAIPGITAKHAIITPTCRANRTPMGAFAEAIERLTAEYEACLNDANREAYFHVALTVDRPGLAGGPSSSEEAAENAVWEEVLEAVQQAWTEPQFYAGSPIELIYRLINERDEAIKRHADLRELIRLKNEEVDRWLGIFVERAAETDRLHSADCRAQEAQREREAQALQAGFELGRSVQPGEEIDDIAGDLFSELCEGDGQHSEALDRALIRKHLERAVRLGRSEHP